MKTYEYKSRAVYEFVDFLEGTLIPDLKADGMAFTARDLVHAIKFIKGAKRVAGQGRKEFLEYLELMEKDLRDSGKENTAQDYFTARMFIYWDR